MRRLMRRKSVGGSATDPFSFDTPSAWQYDRTMTDRPHTPLLDTVDVPADLRKLKPEDLRQFADELRAETISAVGSTGGHLGSGLGVVELTVALHYVFDTPRDKIVWDVGHQCYPHKIITGRRDRTSPDFLHIRDHVFTEFQMKPEDKTEYYI